MTVGWRRMGTEAGRQAHANGGAGRVTAGGRQGRTRIVGLMVLVLAASVLFPTGKVQAQAQRPQVVSMEAHGNQLRVDFDQQMHNGADNPPESHLYGNWFVDVDGRRLDVTDVSISGSRITLTLSKSLPADCSDNEIEVSYRAGAVLGSTYVAERKVDTEVITTDRFGFEHGRVLKLRSLTMYDLFRYPAPNLTTPSTVGSGAKAPCPSDGGPTLTAARVDTFGGALYLGFSNVLDSNSIVSTTKDHFTVMAGGARVPVWSIRTEPVQQRDSGWLALVFGDVGAIRRGQHVTVSYSRPTNTSADVSCHVSYLVKQTGTQICRYHYPHGRPIQAAVDKNDVASFSGFGAQNHSRQRAPLEPLTAAFSGLPTRHTGEAFTFDIAFSEAFPLIAQTLASALSVANGSVTSVAKVDETSTRNWRVTITPSSATANVTVTLALKENCADTGAICTADQRKLSASVEAEVPARKATYITGVSITSNAGADGVWNQGETVRVQITFNAQITVNGPPGSGPAVGITLDGARRVAGYASGNGSTTLTFEHTVTAADDGAARARVVSNSLDLNGYILGDNQGQEAGTYFEVPSELSVADAEGTEGTNSAIAFTVTLDPAASAPVTVDYATADGTATAPADYTATSDTLTFAAGETSKTVEVPIVDDAVEDNGETFTLTLSNPSGATIVDAVATGTIRNTEPRPQVTGVELVADASGDGIWSAGESVEARLTFSEPVTVSGGTPYVEARIVELPVRIGYGSGSGSATLAFAIEVPAGAPSFAAVSLLANSLRASGARIVSVASGLAAELGHDGAEPSAEAGTEDSTPLTAGFRDVPAKHGGNAFTVELRFSENWTTGLSYTTLRDHALTVTNGRVTKVRRLEAEKNQRWEITVEPDGDADVTITLPATTDCGATGAICIGTRPLSSADSATVPHAVPAGTPFTVRFAGVPAEHAGSGEMSFKVLFNKKPPSSYSYVTMRDATLAVGQGRATKAERLNRPHNDQWRVTVVPGGKEDVTVSVGPFASCTETGAVCANGAEVLANSVTATILGPPGLSVADARVDEAADATLDFAVTLSRASSSTVTVDYATADGTATAGEDYTAASDTLTFAPGETSKTVSVAVLDDSIDEGEETLTLTLSSPSGGNAYLKDATATGTIVNSDPMPQAWLARFGRTVASQAVDAIGARMAGGGGTHVTVGGQSLALSGEAMTLEEGEDLEGALLALAESGDAPAATTRSMTGRELLLGSAFRLSAGGESGAPAFTAWGQFATGGFEAHVDSTRMDGSVTTGFLGADVGRARWLAGVALSFSEGDGDYALVEGDDGGDVESSLTALYPYARIGLSDTVDVWGLAGFGQGELTLTQHANANRAEARRYTTDISMRMGAAGVRGEVLSPAEADGLAVAVKSDAFWVRTSSDAVPGMMASEADVSRVRLIVEGSRSFETGGGALTPSLEVGVRHDGGDAETGTGIEVGAGVRYEGRGFSVEGSVRTLVAHEASGYEEWGAAGALRIDPGASGRGLSLTLAPTVGAASSGTDRLWGLGDTRSLAPEGGFEAARTFEAELGYGLGLGSAPGVLTPYAGLSLADGGGRRLRTGARWAIAQGAALGLEAVRAEALEGEPHTHGIALRFEAHW